LQAREAAHRVTPQMKMGGMAAAGEVCGFFARPGRRCFRFHPNSMAVFFGLYFAYLGHSQVCRRMKQQLVTLCSLHATWMLKTPSGARSVLM
jgi:hypothetical protein